MSMFLNNAVARIAIVSYWAPPQGAVASHRILRLSRALLGAGHEVHWVTLDRADLPQVDPTLEPLIPPEVKRHGLGGPCLITKPEAKGIVEKILRTIVYKLPQWFPVPDGYVEWTMRLKRELPAIVARERLDALFFCVGPHGAIMALPRLRGRLKDVKLYVDYRDLLSGNFWRESSSRRIREGLLRRERKALAAADALFVNTAAAKARFEEVVQTPPGFPVEVMRNAADYDLAEQVAAGVPAPDLGEGIHLGYFGTIFPLRRLRPVLEAMDALPDLPLKLHCFSPPNSMKLLDEDCAGLDVAVVKHDTVPYGQALRAMQAMDALVLVNGATKDDAIFVPGKLYDYLMARRPVLFVGEAGDAWNIVAATSGPEWCSRHSEPGKLRAALETLGKGAAPATNANGEYGPATTFQPLLRKLA